MTADTGTAQLPPPAACKRGGTETDKTSPAMIRSSTSRRVMFPSELRWNVVLWAGIVLVACGAALLYDDDDNRLLLLSPPCPPPVPVPVQRDPSSNNKTIPGSITTTTTTAMETTESWTSRILVVGRELWESGTTTTTPTTTATTTATSGGGTIGISHSSYDYANPYLTSPAAVPPPPVNNNDNNNNNNNINTNMNYYNNPNNINPNTNNNNNNPNNYYYYQQQQQQQQPNYYQQQPQQQQPNNNFYYQQQQLQQPNSFYYQQQQQQQQPNFYNQGGQPANYNDAYLHQVPVGQATQQQQQPFNPNDYRFSYPNGNQQQQQQQNFPSTVTEDHLSHRAIYNEEHEPLFPLSRSDIYGFILAILSLMVAAGGGIGGGGMLVPIYCLVMGFSPKHAIPLSNITVFGGSLANTFLNIQKRHPLANRPLVDWDLILVMEPLTIAGALMGAFLNKVLPELLLTILLVVLLVATAYTTFAKARKMYKKETLALQAAAESELTRMAAQQEREQAEKDHAADTDSLLANQEGQGNGEGENDDDDAGGGVEESKTAHYSDTKDEAMKDVELGPSSAARIVTPHDDDDDDDDDGKINNKDLQQLLEEESKTPVFNLQILIIMFVVVLAINLLKGGGAFPSPLGIKCGSAAFWLANALMLFWILAISYYVRVYLLRKFYRKKQCSFQYVDGDIQWDERSTIVYPVVCCLAGFFAGMFGVGGGIVKGPLMLAMGVHPAVSSASSACMILFTSFTATTSFVVFGLLVEDYAVVCVIMGFVATIVGQLGLGIIMKRAKRNSYIAFSIGIVVMLSAVLMTIQSLLSMASGEHHHAGGICGKGD